MFGVLHADVGVCLCELLRMKFYGISLQLDFWSREYLVAFATAGRDFVQMKEISFATKSESILSKPSLGWSARTNASCFDEGYHIQQRDLSWSSI